MANDYSTHRAARFRVREYCRSPDNGARSAYGRAHVTRRLQRRRFGWGVVALFQGTEKSGIGDSGGTEPDAAGS